LTFDFWVGESRSAICFKPPLGDFNMPSWRRIKITIRTKDKETVINLNAEQEAIKEFMKNLHRKHRGERRSFLGETYEQERKEK